MKKRTLIRWKQVLRSLRPVMGKSTPERLTDVSFAKTALKRIHPFSEFLLRQHYVKRVPLQELLGDEFWPPSGLTRRLRKAEEDFAYCIDQIQEEKGWTPPARKPASNPPKKAVERKVSVEQLLDSNTPWTPDLCLQLFDLPGNASPDSLTKSYRELMRRYHSDMAYTKGPDAVGLATYRSQRINHARDILMTKWAGR